MEGGTPSSQGVGGGGVPASSLMGGVTPSSLKGGVPPSSPMGYPHPEIGYTPCPKMGVTPHPSPPSPRGDRAAQRVLAPRQAVCLLCLRRRTFLSSKVILEFFVFSSPYFPLMGSLGYYWFIKRFGNVAKIHRKYISVWFQVISDFWPYEPITC